MKHAVRMSVMDHCQECPRKFCWKCTMKIFHVSKSTCKSHRSTQVTLSETLFCNNSSLRASVPYSHGSMCALYKFRAAHPNCGRCCHRGCSVNYLYRELKRCFEFFYEFQVARFHPPDPFMQQIQAKF